MQGEGLDFTRCRYIDIPANKAADLAIREGDFLISRANGSLRLMGRAFMAGNRPVPTVVVAMADRIRAGGEDPAEYLEVSIKVPERASVA